MGRDVAVLHPLNTVITEPSTGLRFVTVLVPSPLRYDHDVPRCRLRGGPDTFSGPAKTGDCFFDLPASLDWQVHEDRIAAAFLPAGPRPEWTLPVKDLSNRLTVNSRAGRGGATPPPVGRRAAYLTAFALHVGNPTLPYRARPHPKDHRHLMPDIRVGHTKSPALVGSSVRHAICNPTQKDSTALNPGRCDHTATMTRARRHPFPSAPQRAARKRRPIDARGLPMPGICGACSRRRNDWTDTYERARGNSPQAIG